MESTIYCAYANSDRISRWILINIKRYNHNYILFNGTINQFHEDFLKLLMDNNLLVHASGNICNLNYGKHENPRLKWVLIRNDTDKLSELAAQHEARYDTYGVYK